ncbi:hypothetical protein GWK08_16450 [Leptobacterium flavescens]|uniref:DUF4386 family protein n=1 Tax=Leptobacterium flavescens TaxID=472055 RepID=A0A6P0UST5_9FLAO|nr:hypothetical protein [Leptobacterium flavescens]NER15048.1 hypothetical protein [Leptobacterium flavescens]
MKDHFHKSTGISLISGSLLIIATMVLHPSGGSLQRIVEITGVITIAHSLAVFCLPIVLFGFYGLTNKLMESSRVSILAFIIMAFSLIAAMFAALLNGLALPYFLGKYSNSLEEKAEVLKPISSFSFAVNTSLDYIFIAGCCLAILIYSVLLISKSRSPKWIGYFGILILVFAAIGALTGFVFTSLTGFRIFTFSLAAWILSAGFYLIKSE